MADKTIGIRTKRQRERRGAEGWVSVRVWVPTERDAADVRKLAEKRRAQAEALRGLSEEVPSVTPEIAARIATAIAEHGSAAYTTPSGAVLDLLTQLTEEDDLATFSRAFVILARAKPSNAALVAAAVPAKITNFLVRHRNVDASTLIKWTNANPGWEDDLKNAVRNPKRFEQVVATMAEAIKRQRKPH
jgi:hypothetical protein